MRSWTTGANGTPVHCHDAQGHWAPRALCTRPCWKLFERAVLSESATEKAPEGDLFNVAWLNNKLQHFAELRPADINATLTELTAQACANTVKQYGGGATLMAVCGGGALNNHLMHRLKDFRPLPRGANGCAGLPVMQVEACAFLLGWPVKPSWAKGNLPNVTGALAPVF